MQIFLRHLLIVSNRRRLVSAINRAVKSFYGLFLKELGPLQDCCKSESIKGKKSKIYVIYEYLSIVSMASNLTYY